MSGSQLDRSALRAGAGVCLVFAVPLSILATVAANADNTGLAVVLVLGALGGFVVGSGVAAWVQQRGLPLLHAVTTASSTYLAAQAVFITLRLLTGRDVRWFAALFNLAPVLFAGAVGGLLGALLQRQGFQPSSRPGPRRSGPTSPQEGPS
ncbi:MAG: hypothetical protein RI958_660 [Actinomycetota bacterium]|jgi:hypothetical protein